MQSPEKFGSGPGIHQHAMLHVSNTALLHTVTHRVALAVEPSPTE